MQNTPVKLLDVVALLRDKPAEGLVAGQVGTVVEVLAPGVFEVEFLDSQGRTVVFPNSSEPNYWHSNTSRPWQRKPSASLKGGERTWLPGTWSLVCGPLSWTALPFNWAELA